MRGSNTAGVDGVTEEVSVERRLEGKWEAGSGGGGWGGGACSYCCP